MYHNFKKESDNYGQNLAPHMLKNRQNYQSQYARDYNHLQEQYRRQEEEWMRKRQREEQLMMKLQDKPRTYDYTAPYQSLFPPRDINKYFHDSKYMDDAPKPKPDEYYFPETQAPFRENPGTGLSTYERDFITPGFPRMTQQIPGGLYIVRFHNNGTDNVNLSYKEQQTIIKSFNGHVIGMAGRDCRSTPNIMVLSGESDWRHSKEGLADNVAMLWFPSRDKAFDFFSNSFRNRFKEQGFPSPHGWESYFIPMNTPILIMSLNTYLIVEVLNRGKHTANDIKTVEEHGARMIKGRIPNSLPFVAACDFRAREAFKPGPLFGDRSTIFISRFGSMNDAREVWESGMMNEALAAGGFTAPTKAVIIQLHDWMDL